MEQRRARRFKLQLPLAVTRPIEYIITLNTGSEFTVNLRCIGKVVRSERVPEADDMSYAVAATLERYEFVRNDGAPN